MVNRGWLCERCQKRLDAQAAVYAKWGTGAGPDQLSLCEACSDDLFSWLRLGPHPLRVIVLGEPRQDRRRRLTALLSCVRWPWAEE
jgi:hypothetical protein